MFSSEGMSDEFSSGRMVKISTSSQKKKSGSALFAIQYLNLYQQPGSSNLVG